MSSCSALLWKAVSSCPGSRASGAQRCLDRFKGVRSVDPRLAACRADSDSGRSAEDRRSHRARRMYPKSRSDWAQFLQRTAADQACFARSTGDVPRVASLDLAAAGGRRESSVPRSTSLDPVEDELCLIRMQLADSSPRRCAAAVGEHGEGKDESMPNALTASRPSSSPISTG